MTDNKSNEIISLVEVLKDAINKEHVSCDYYNRAATGTVKPAVKKMFLKLAEMERGHALELAKQLSDLEAQTFIDKAITANF
ncbi:MAG: hypothetical protein A2Y48_10710 [Nitrospirae bacterium RIFCSPLOW2_12_42_9]|nr:MAG: hypothetical protein A2035_07785 [Nitrospirae bacterium GWA2_42_11]OGW56829.1 MAG: hypothetical protein A2Y48_10710 [Nitrospirae bacterium RIFCSPLOW2_12_42_9]HAS17711.1 hypothetical protein [Nitrospiraceae bacterium]